MVLTKAELIGSLKDEVRILLHLASKVDLQQLDYRPTAKQRSTLELLQYLTIVGPIHLGTIASGTFSMDAWRDRWRSQEKIADARDLEQAKQEIGSLAKMFEEVVGGLSDADLRAPMQMFGQTASRGLWIVRLVLNHYTAYRMQLFLYLKASGREELNTMNLWVGMDAPN
jgi:uncharacterized damage-inducible protein DinB